MALVAAYPQFLYRNTCHNYQVGEIRKVSSFSRGEITELVQLLKSQSRAVKHSDGRSVKVQVFWQNVERPTSVEMELISSEEQLDQVLDEALQRSQPIVIDWMATWCRKCIYLKPKLEKLAAEFYPKIKFYYVNVNSVPQTLVKRAGISKMPTIQLWKNGEKQAEVIGGHKAWLVVEEVREMIEKH